MDNTIAGFIGITLFLLFIGGLAESIGAVPFIVIVTIIGAMALYDYYQQVREERKRANYMSLHHAMEEGANEPTTKLD